MNLQNILIAAFWTFFISGTIYGLKKSEHPFWVCSYISFISSGAVTMLLAIALYSINCFINLNIDGLTKTIL